MPIYPGRRKGTHRVVVWTAGKRHEAIVEGRPQDARDHEAKMRLDLRASRTLTQQRTDPLFSVFSMAEYAPHARAHLGADSWRKARKYVVKNLAVFFGRYRLSELSAALLAEYVAVRLPRVKASTVNLELRVLGVMLRFAEECGHIVPALRIRKLREERRRVHVWTPAEQGRLLDACRRHDPDLLPMVVFMLETGCRKGEAIAALWSWVDRTRRLLCISPREGWAPKNKRPREVPITDTLWATLRKLTRERACVFPNVHGDRYVCFPYERFTAVRKRAKLHGGPHSCRHSFASTFLDAGGSLHDLSGILGHSLTKTTELYVHLLPTHLDRARGVMNARPRLPSAKTA